MKRKLLLPCFTALSVLLAAYGPMTTFASAQSASDAKLQDLKSKSEQELNRRITSIKDTLSSLDASVQLTPGGSSASVSTDHGSASIGCIPTSSPSPSSSASPTVTPGATLTFKNGQLVGDVKLPCGIHDKVKSFLQQVLTQLTTLLGKVQSTSSLTDMLGLAKSVDGQASADQAAQAQAGVTQAIGSMSDVANTLKTSWNDMQSQVTKLKDCAHNQSGSSTSPSPSASGSPSDGCGGGGFNIDFGAILQQAQSILTALMPVIQMIFQIIMSAVSMMLPLLLSLTGMLSGGSGGGGMGSLGGIMDPSMLIGLASTIPSMLMSFTSILSELGTSSNMSSNASGSLGGITSLLGGAGH